MSLYNTAIAEPVSLTLRLRPRFGAVKESQSLVRVNCRRTYALSRSRLMSRQRRHNNSPSMSLVVTDNTYV